MSNHVSDKAFGLKPLKIQPTTMHTRLLVLLLAACYISCQPDTAPTKEAPTATLTPEQQEARDDSIALDMAYAAQARITRSVQPVAETDAIQAATPMDAADDPAIWIHPTDPMRSVIYGSNKTGGIAAYDLDGREIAYYPVGNINNVDVIDGVPFGGKRVSLLGGTNRSDQSLDLFLIDPVDGKLTDIADGALGMDSTLIDDVYGFCFAHHREADKFYAILNGKNGRVQQYELIPSQGRIGIALRRTIDIDSQTEGMVADADLGYLYIGEENRGVWKLRIDPADTTRQLVAATDTSNADIRYDVEGLTLYRDGDVGYLIVSSQGSFSYAVYERQGDNRYIGSFKITASDTLDGAEETDGLDVTATPLGDAYPKGLLVVQDGFNYDGDTLRAQNFKYVSWREVMGVLE